MSLRLTDRWPAYWLAPGGRLGTAMLRIGIATSLLMLLYRYANNQDPLGSALYHRLGVWLLYPGRPSPALVDLLLSVAWVATLLFLVGAFTRASHVVSLVATMAVAAHGVSDTPTWSHTDVPPLLASIALLGARSGDAWSVDAFVRGRRGQPLPPAHQGPIRLVQVAVVAVFATAAYHKLKAGGPTLGWAFSDNLRHHLLVKFDWIGLPRTAVAEWLLQASWRYELFAALNLVSQLLPVATLGLFRYPTLRALLGVLFVLEVLGLAVVMDLWNLHWLPLAVVFVDWDRLLGEPVPDATVTAPRSRRYVVWATGFVAFFALQAFWLNQRLRAFPFSSFPMFAQVRAKPPYGEHQTYELAGGHIEVMGARDPGTDVQAWIDFRGTYRWYWRYRDPAQLQRALQGVVDETTAAFPAYGIDRARLALARFQAPAYPAAPRLDRADLAVIAALAADGTLTTALGTLGADGRTLVPTSQSPTLAGARVYAIANLAAAPVPLRATPGAEGLVLAPDAAVFARFAAYVVVEPAGSSTRWLVRGVTW